MNELQPQLVQAPEALTLPEGEKKAVLRSNQKGVGSRLVGVVAAAIALSGSGVSTEAEAGSGRDIAIGLGGVALGYVLAQPSNNQQQVQSQQQRPVLRPQTSAPRAPEVRPDQNINNNVELSVPDRKGFEELTKKLNIFWNGGYILINRDHTSEIIDLRRSPVPEILHMSAKISVGVDDSIKIECNVINRKENKRDFVEYKVFKGEGNHYYWEIVKKEDRLVELGQ